MIISQASRPLSGTKCSMVVRDICDIPENMILSQPRTDTSPGILYFSSWRASMMPKAIMSLRPANAVTFLGRARISFVRLYPILYSESMLGSWSSRASSAAFMMTWSPRPSFSYSSTNPATRFERCCCLFVRGGAINATSRCPKSRRCLAIRLPTLVLSWLMASTSTRSLLLIMTNGIFFANSSTCDMYTGLGLKV